MDTLIVTAKARGEISAALASVEAQLERGLGGREPALIMVFASTAQPLEGITPPLSQRFASAVVLGASTAGEFTEAGTGTKTVAVVAIAGDMKVYAGMAANLKRDAARAVEEALADVPTAVPGYSHRTGLLLLDPLAGNGEEVTLMIATLLGEQPLAGGAAGDDLQMKVTHVSCNGRVASDAVVFAQIFTKTPLGLGVAHGHRAMSESLRVTKAAGNVVHEINERAAWDVWVEHTRKRALEDGVDPATIPFGKEVAHLLL